MIFNSKQTHTHSLRIEIATNNSKIKKHFVAVRNIDCMLIKLHSAATEREEGGRAWISNECE